MRDLGALSGDVQSAGLSINNEGEVVGPSLDEDGNPTAYVWRNGAMSDLNSLVIGESPCICSWPQATMMLGRS